MKKVEVLWGDAAAGGGAWEDLGEVGKMELSMCSTMGYIVKNDRKVIILVQSFCENGTALNKTVIPKGSVTSITELKI